MAEEKKDLRIKDFFNIKREASKAATLEKISGEVGRVEKTSAPEQTFEKSAGEVSGEAQKGTEDEGKITAVAGGIVATDMAAREDEERLKEIEEILSDGFEEVYRQMPPAKQAEFKARGEEAARGINELLSRAKIKAQKIIELIKKWLSVVPGIDKFFLEQEAKIKTDQLLRIKR